MTLNQELANFFCKGPDDNYFWLCGPFGLHGSCSTLPCGTKAASEDV